MSDIKLPAINTMVGVLQDDGCDTVEFMRNLKGIGNAFTILPDLHRARDHKINKAVVSIVSKYVLELKAS